MIYMICVVLAVFYAVIFYAALHPDVTPEYTNYYILKTDEKWMGNDAYCYEPGEVLSFTKEHEDRAVRHMVFGWSTPEETHCWSDGARSQLFFRNLPSGEMNLVISVVGIVDDCAAKLFANDVPIGEIEAAEAAYPAKFEWTIPDGVTENGCMRIDFEYTNPHTVGQDNRLLGMAIEEVIING